jgi:MoaA/NifB/PqqE/SkfB family radical SAM enzyme
LLTAKSTDAVLQQHPDYYLTPAENVVIWHGPGEILLMCAKTLSIDPESEEILMLCDGKTSIRDLLNKVKDPREGNGSRLCEVRKFIALMLATKSLEMSPVPIERTFEVMGTEHCPVPIHATVELTDRCNLICVYCYRESGPQNSKYLDDPLAFMGNLREQGIRVVELSGGEPLLHPEINEILVFCATKFNHVAILTNGTMMTKKTLGILAQFKDKCVVQVSLPAISREEYRRITGRDLLGKALASIKSLNEMSIRFRIGSVVVDEVAIDAIVETARFAHESGALQYVFTPMLKGGRGKNLCFSRQAMLALHNTIEEMKTLYPRGFLGIIEEGGPTIDGPPQRNCGAGVRSITFDPEKTPRPCPMFPVDLSSRRLFDNSNRVALANIRAPREDTCSGCEHVQYCKNCYLRGYLRWRECPENCRWGITEDIGKKISRLVETYEED